MDGSTAEIMPDDVVLDSFVAIIDLREGDSRTHMIAGSVRIDRLDLDRMQGLAPSPDAPILLYCGIGEVSRIAARSLAERGYPGFVSLFGGFRRWRAEERPIVTTDDGTTIRYDRHVRLAGFGQDGQDKIAAAGALVLGAGGLGSPVIQYLSAAGVGTITIVDGDTVDSSNLQRQVLFDEAAVGAKKVDAAVASVRALNSDVTAIPVATWLDSANALHLIKGHDLVVDASDNYASRLAVNDAAVALGIPFIHGAAIRWEGLVAGFDPRVGPCYRCLFPELPENETACSDVGVLGAVTGVVGSLMAVEALKHIIGSPDRLVDRLITYDARSARF
ncbi:MAG: ThiF family adenylyltransferase, partial [Actinomycetota bacterium]|nr:ThiF family adenylyltransferase [Actinomycetota bacterium]